MVGTEYAEAFAACQEFAASNGALLSHAYDHPLITAGAGPLMDEIRAQVPEVDTVVVAVGGGGALRRRRRCCHASRHPHDRRRARELQNPQRRARSRWSRRCYRRLRRC
ncbi:pyridoxal-phosphate dependent enzyme [Arthrobacter bambusae]|uniref:pyridoxal-phosphate dependent enzyme n=1 Tax=Arthrobacter bambusae TaxID=1338426 RepID=UPI0027D835C4|nr:pyridoxal-phosphate dependent enzyme [Arthrobacter bambusae]